jgi:ATP-binding cassette subfamily C (CFTR/MRP) protein 1
MTEQKILELISTEFKGATVITIAHRLNTIMKSDRVLVMDSGKVIEYDSPQELLKNSSSKFS